MFLFYAFGCYILRNRLKVISCFPSLLVDFGAASLGFSPGGTAKNLVRSVISVLVWVGARFQSLPWGAEIPWEASAYQPIYFVTRWKLTDGFSKIKWEFIRNQQTFTDQLENYLSKECGIVLSKSQWNEQFITQLLQHPIISHGTCLDNNAVDERVLVAAPDLIEQLLLSRLSAQSHVLDLTNYGKLAYS